MPDDRIAYIPLWNDDHISGVPTESEHPPRMRDLETGLVQRDGEPYVDFLARVARARRMEGNELVNFHELAKKLSRITTPRVQAWLERWRK